MVSLARAIKLSAEKPEQVRLYIQGGAYLTLQELNRHVSFLCQTRLGGIEDEGAARHIKIKITLSVPFDDETLWRRLTAGDIAIADRKKYRYVSARKRYT